MSVGRLLKDPLVELQLEGEELEKEEEKVRGSGDQGEVVLEEE